MVDLVEFPLDPDAPLSSLVYAFGGAEAVAELKPGQVLSTTTRDCFAGRVRTTADLPSQVCDLRYINPQTGPFHIAGAEPGDTLAVHFVSIEPSEPWGVSATFPFFGALTSSRDTATLQPPLDERVWVYDLDRQDRVVYYQALDADLRLPLPMDPMHGTVGVAPAMGEVRNSLAPGAWGGNMDTPEMRAGATCYLGVNEPGALFSIGDGHARQGEGEACGVAVECSMNTVLVVDVIRGDYAPWPRLETNEYLITTGSTKPLEDAFRIALTEMVRWIESLLELTTMDAYQLVSQTALTPIANVCDTVYTVTCKVPKALLPETSAYGGIHQALSSKAAAL
ncbi:MAG: acetamidase/formamidase family protein [bacterium]|nr:acetamidase/formamidase family protein [bacterium]